MTIDQHSKQRYLDNPKGDVDILDDPRNWNNEGQEEGADWHTYNKWEADRTNREDIKQILKIQSLLIRCAYDMGELIDELKKINN